MGRIEVDFHQTIRQADELEEIAKRIDDIANKKLPQTMQSIIANWNSKGSEAFIRKCDSTKNSILCTGEKLEQTASHIKMIAKRVYEVELRAKEIATTRTIK